MRRTLLAAGVLFSASLATSTGMAGDKTFKVVISPAAHKPAAVAGSTAKRKRIEHQLQAPLDLPLKGRETITLGELIKHVQTKHHIAIRFDEPTLRTILRYGVDFDFNIQDESDSCVDDACPSEAALNPSARLMGTCTAPACGASPVVTLVASGPVPMDLPSANRACPLKGTAGQDEKPIVVLQGLIANSASSVALGRSPLVEPTVVGATIQGVVLEVADSEGATPAAVTQSATFNVVLDGALPAALALDKEEGTEAAKCRACPACPSSSCCSDAAVAELPAKSVWRTSFAQAKAEAESRKVPLVVQFEAAWCGPCRKMAKVLESPEVLKALGTDCVGVRVNVDQSPELVSKYKVEAIPTTVIVHPNGARESMHFQVSSAITEPAYLALLKSCKTVENASDAPAAACFFFYRNKS